MLPSDPTSRSVLNEAHEQIFLRSLDWSGTDIIINKAPGWLIKKSRHPGNSYILNVNKTNFRLTERVAIYKPWLEQ